MNGMENQSFQYANLSRPPFIVSSGSKPWPMELVSSEKARRQIVSKVKKERSPWRLHVEFFPM